MSSSSPDRSLPPLPQDPPTAPNSIRHSVSEASGTSLSITDSGTESRRSSRSRRSKESSVVYDEITRTFKKLQSQVLDEKKRADEAERRLAEVTAHLKAVNEARLQAASEAARAKEELKLYKIQLDTAQREIYRAQDVIAIVDRQRYAAEKEAAKNRTKARQLNETLIVQAAREEAWRMGLKEGLDRGRNIALAEHVPAGFDPCPPEGEMSFQDTESSHETEEPQPTHFVARTPSMHSRAPSQHPPDDEDSPSPEPIPTNFPHVMPTPTPSQPVTMPEPSRPSSVAPSESIRPVSVRNYAPTPQMMPSASLIPDNFIPVLDADNRIRIPPPFELSRTPDPAASPQLDPMTESMEALPIPPPVQAPPQQHTPSGSRQGYHRRNSSSGSSSLSALDILSNAPLSNNMIRTPMSIIPEVQSQTTGSSPHNRSFDMQNPNFNLNFQSPPTPSSHTPNWGQFRVETPSHRSLRPSSRQSFAGSHTGSYRPPQGQQFSHESSIDIDIQPPSQPLSHKSESVGQQSPQPGPSPRISGMPPPSLSDMPAPIAMPVPSQPEFFDPQPDDIRASTPGPARSTATSRMSRTSRRSARIQEVPLNDEDDAVSSVISADTLTTPPGRRRELGGEGPGEGESVVRGKSGSVVGGGSAYGGGSVKGSRSVKGGGSVYGGGSVNDGGSAYGGGSPYVGGGDGSTYGGGGASAVGRQPSIVSRLGSSIGYPEPSIAGATDMAGVGSGHGRKKKGKRK